MLAVSNRQWNNDALPRGWSKEGPILWQNLGHGSISIEVVVENRGTPPLREISVGQAKSESRNDNAKRRANVESTGEHVVVADFFELVKPMRFSIEGDLLHQPKNLRLMNQLKMRPTTTHWPIHQVVAGGIIPAPPKMAGKKT